MRVLVCGGRDFDDEDRLFATLSEMHQRDPISCVIEGGASGADDLAEEWALQAKVPCETYVANWRVHGRAAGPIRNKQMLDIGIPDLVVAFPGGKGTENMMKQARDAGVKVIEIQP